MTASDTDNKVGACHCKTCRQWGGGPFMEISCGTDVSIGGEDSVTVYDSSEWAERGFCNKCGTHLFYRLKGTGQHMVPVGFFADDEGLEFTSQVFIDSRPDYYAFSNKTHDMTGAELFAKYAPPD
ncbi:MAG: GFA family protein [Gammaproteobacteria bacterium]|nr:GFA family protein [Gammaproteobacteria bacterium]